ncbi:transcriptional regulator (plasmid) [Sinorhizobium meliloti]|nr:transcriptional regulator [Sinorhizobium meliloti]
MIIYRLLNGPRRFGELRRLVGDPSQRSLTMQLRELEADGSSPAKSSQRFRRALNTLLTPFGQTLAPVLIAMRDWGVAFQERARPRNTNLRCSSQRQRLRRTSSTKKSIRTRTFRDTCDPGGRTM